MPIPDYTLTCCAPALQIADLVTRLSIALFQTPYAFLQRFQPQAQTELDIFDAQLYLLMRVVFQPGAPGTPMTLTASPSLRPDLPAAAASLVATLTQAGATGLTQAGDISTT